MANEPAITRYRQLLERADFDLKLARDVALSLALPSRRIARLNRARRELGDERDELIAQPQPSGEVER